MDQLKAKYWERLQSGINQAFNSWRTDAKKVIEQNALRAKTSIDARIDRYVEAYKSVVDTMIREHHAAVDKLRSIEYRTETDIKEIDRRLKTISIKRQRLADTVHS